jgi:hypothetical protein
MNAAKPRHEYEVTDTFVDRLPNDSAALHILTRQDIDLTVLLTADQLQRLQSQIASLSAS